jgi:hypothetical protein
MIATTPPQSAPPEADAPDPLRPRWSPAAVPDVEVKSIESDARLWAEVAAELAE